MIPLERRFMRTLGNLVAAALATAWLTLVAAPASAAIYLASYGGVIIGGTGSNPNSANPTYDMTNYFGLGSNLVGSSFTAQFKYDTSLGVPFTNATTDSRYGGPMAGCGACLSPILEASITVNGITDYFNVNGAGYANVTINPMGWRQTFFALGYFDNNSANALQLYVLNAPNPLVLGSEFTGSDVGNLGPPDTDPYARGVILGQRDYRLALSNRTVTLAAIPEPATWGLMIIGFAGAGVMLRSRRRVLARI
jgi:hypothetical protein